MFNVVVGTYEKTLYGFQVDTTQASVEVSPIFAFATSHLGCIKTVSIDQEEGAWCATGSTDESLRVYNLFKKKEVGTLLEHTASVTCSQFYSNTHFLSGSDDASVIIYRVGDWEPIKILNGHMLAINSISIHPSGKLALTSSKDRSLRLWNLTNGRAAFDQNLTYEAELMAWSPSGTTYAVGSFHTVRIFSTEAGKLQEFEAKNLKHILCIVYLTDDYIATGGEDRVISVWNVKTGKCEFTLAGFENRIKGLAIFPKAGAQFPFLVSISSDESLKVWDINKSKEFPIAEKIIRSRLTCLAVGPVPGIAPEEAAPKVAAPAKPILKKPAESPKAEKKRVQIQEPRKPKEGAAPAASKPPQQGQKKKNPQQQSRPQQGNKKQGGDGKRQTGTTEGSKKQKRPQNDNNLSKNTQPKKKQRKDK